MVWVRIRAPLRLEKTFKITESNEAIPKQMLWSTHSGLVWLGVSNELNSSQFLVISTNFSNIARIKWCFFGGNPAKKLRVE